MDHGEEGQREGAHRNRRLIQVGTVAGALSQQRIASPFLRGTEKEKESGSESRSVASDSLQPLGLYSPWNSPGQDTGWVAVPFSRGSSHTRDQTQVSHTAGGFFTSRVAREELN